MADALKDQMFQRPFFEKLTNAIIKNYSQFSKNDFFNFLYDEEWGDKALKERMYHASQCLQKTLPQKFPQALKTLTAIAQDFNGFDGMIFPDFVEQFGLGHYQISIEALELLTQFSSAEFAIRPFILQKPTATMNKMLGWSLHHNEHVRRLSSEGCRPRLPWAMALSIFKKNPALILPILDNLRSDPSLYVRKSVANNINDISKDNSDIALKLLDSWQENSSSETKWITKHALRGLLKAGNQSALHLLGFKAVKISLYNFTLKPKTLTMGQELIFSFLLKNNSKTKQSLMVDYIIYFMKANGKTAPKVFKLKTINIRAGEEITITKGHKIKPISTRKYYAGQHQLAIQVNGQLLDNLSFKLKK